MMFDAQIDPARSVTGRCRWWLTPFLALALLLLSIQPVVGQTPTTPAATAEPSVSAAAALLVDLTNGHVLFSREPHARRAVASLTKVMTAVVALQHGQLADEILIEDRDLPGEASIGLKVGERVTLETLLYGMLMRSGNDAAAAIARGVGERVVAQRGLRGGGQAVFVDLMNQQAASLGMANTHFVNPHGLDEAGHVSSAYDMALLTQHALRDPTFARIFGARSYPYRAGAWANANRLLYGYEALVGGKTGVTDEAGLCLIEVAERGGRRLVAVVLDAPHWYTDAQALLDYGFRTGRAAPIGGELFGAASPPSGPIALSTALSPPPVDTPSAGVATATPAPPATAASATQRAMPTVYPTVGATRAPMGGGASGGGVGLATDGTARLISAPVEEGAWQGALISAQSGADDSGSWLPLGLGILALMLALAIGGLWLRMTGVRPWQSRGPRYGPGPSPAWRRSESPALFEDAEPEEEVEEEEVDGEGAQATGRLDELAPAQDEASARAPRAAERPSQPSTSETDELATAHLAVAVRYVNEGRPDAAESAFMKALQIAPDFRFSTAPLFWSLGPEGYVALAAAYRRCNRPADARALVVIGLLVHRHHPSLKALDEQGQRERRDRREAVGD